MKKIALSIGIAVCTLLATNAQDTKTKTEPKPVQIQPVTKTPLLKTTARPQQVTATPHQHHEHEHQQQPVSQDPNAPEMVFETDVIDYGKVEYNGDGYREARFTNTGKEPLIITSVKGSCGCTVPTWPKEPIMPGKSGVIKVKYTTNKVGKFSKTITISSNARNPIKRLTVKGEVGPKPVAPAEETVPVKKVIEGATPVENR